MSGELVLGYLPQKIHDQIHDDVNLLVMSVGCKYTSILTYLELVVLAHGIFISPVLSMLMRHEENVTMYASNMGVTLHEIMVLESRIQSVPITKL